MIGLPTISPRIGLLKPKYVENLPGIVASKTLPSFNVTSKTLFFKNR